MLLSFRPPYFNDLFLTLQFADVFYIQDFDKNSKFLGYFGSAENVDETNVWHIVVAPYLLVKVSTWC